MPVEKLTSFCRCMEYIFVYDMYFFYRICIETVQLLYIMCMKFVSLLYTIIIIKIHTFRPT